MRPLISQFLSGGILLGSLAIAFFFFRFWQKTRDSLFAVFAAAFCVLGFERVLLLATTSGVGQTDHHELRPYVYLIRFFAFMLIIVAFYLKNRRT